MRTPAPIGVFDSGVGGLTVLRAIHARLPQEGTVYVGDSARMPYGAKGADTVIRYALAAGQFLAGQGAKVLVVACSTASSVALPALRDALKIPVLGVIDAGVTRALAVSRGGTICIAATEGTTRSGAYVRALEHQRPGVKVVARACPLFAPLVEEGSVEGHLADVVVKHHLGGLEAAGVDTLVLGCTHYPLLTQTLRSVLGGGIQIVDGAEGVADELVSILDSRGLRAATDAPRRSYFSTDAPEKFQVMGSRFLGAAVPQVDLVEL